MALIKCSECGKEISDKASACPHCGYPMGEIKVTEVERPAQEAPSVQVEAHPPTARTPAQEVLHYDFRGFFSHFDRGGACVRKFRRPNENG
ncbi:zinc-ribbon domain-containing protein [Synergistes jonesii]|uniref:zinc-ribbon domain-containing protein n=1 Tax=Synergistes jonesii TaxID=2754 RepID=UPI0009F23DB5